MSTIVEALEKFRGTLYGNRITSTYRQTPVRLPLHIREDAFFYKAENRAVVNGMRPTDTFVVPSPAIVRDRTFWTAIGFVIITILLALMGFEL